MKVRLHIRVTELSEEVRHDSVRSFVDKRRQPVCRLDDLDRRVAADRNARTRLILVSATQRGRSTRREECGGEWGVEECCAQREETSVGCGVHKCVQ